MRAEMQTDEAIVTDGDAGLDALEIPGGGFIDGEWVTWDLSLAVTDPEDDALIAHVHVADAAARDRAIAGVQRSLREDDWELWERRETLERAATLIRSESARLARIISAESSKTITEATREVARTGETIRLSAASGHLLEGDTLPLADTPRGAGRFGWNRRAPLGVITFDSPLDL